MKKTVMYTETRTWFFDLDMSEDADLDKTMRALKDTNGFYFYIDDCTSDEYESTWQEMPEDWRSGSDPDYTEDFRSIAKKELKGENLKIVLASLARTSAIERKGRLLKPFIPYHFPARSCIPIHIHLYYT